LDLKGIAWPRSILTNSVSDLLSPARSRSYGRNNEGGGAHREDVVDEVSAALEVGSEGDLGVLDDGEVQDGVQLEQAKATVCSEISRASCKREERRLELGVLAGELWA
jgi:hypothetical protein